MGVLDFTEGGDDLDFTRIPLKAYQVAYNPANPGSWAPVPTTVQEALDTLIMASSSGVVIDECTLTFTSSMNAGTTVNIQTGAYTPGGPAVVSGDLVVLPASGAAFVDNGAIEVILNGQELTKGPGSGTQAAQWASSIQLKINVKVHAGNTLVVRAPH